MARTAAMLAMSLMLLVHLCTSHAQASVMDKDGDGVVTAEEFVEHAHSQEACANGACTADDAKAALRGEGEDQEAEAGEGMMTPEQFAACKEDVRQQVASGKAVKLSHGNYAAILEGTQNVMMKFSTSWCGHCVKMEPDWQRLAALVHKEYKGCLVVSVDCEATPDICQAFSVQGYPTIMLLMATKTETGEIGYQPVPYKGQRDFASMLGFIKQNKAAAAKNWIWATLKGLLGQVSALFQIQVQMPK